MSGFAKYASGSMMTAYRNSFNSAYTCGICTQADTWCGWLCTAPQQAPALGDHRCAWTLSLPETERRVTGVIIMSTHRTDRVQRC